MSRQAQACLLRDLHIRLLAMTTLSAIHEVYQVGPDSLKLKRRHGSLAWRQQLKVPSLSELRRQGMLPPQARESGLSPMQHV